MYCIAFLNSHTLTFIAYHYHKTRNKGIESNHRHNSVTEAASSHSTPVERREVLAQSIKKAKASINTGGFFSPFPSVSE